MIIWPLTWHRFETTKIYSKQSIYLVLLEHCGKSTLERCGYGELLTFIWTFLSQTKCIIVDTVSAFIKLSSFTNSLVQHVVNFHEFSISHFSCLTWKKTIINWELEINAVIWLAFQSICLLRCFWLVNRKSSHFENHIWLAETNSSTNQNSGIGTFEMIINKQIFTSESVCDIFCRLLQDLARISKAMISARRNL